jgi:hypothetical protein
MVKNREPICQSSLVFPSGSRRSNMASKPSKIIRCAAVGELIIATGIVLFWIGFYTIGLVDIPDPRLKEIYLAYEFAFPVADICLALVLFRGGLGLLLRTSTGNLFSLLGGAALVYLGMLDVSFNAQHGIYRLGLEEALLNGAINIVCLAYGIFLVLMVWKNKGVFRSETNAQLK